MNNLSSKLKAKRVELGFSQRELAKKIGVTGTSISQWEREENIPKGISLFKLADVLNVSVEWLTNGEFERKQHPIHNVLVDYFPMVFASGGGGTFVDDESSEEIYIPVQVIGSSTKKNIKCIHVSGDSMEPYIMNGAIIAIDTEITNIIDGHTYVFDQEGHLRVKELRHGVHEIYIRSKNQNYPDEKAHYNEIRIIGKVKWISNFL